MFCLPPVRGKNIQRRGQTRGGTRALSAFVPPEYDDLMEDSPNLLSRLAHKYTLGCFTLKVKSV
jgi:hypothetical protein